MPGGMPSGAGRRGSGGAQRPQVSASRQMLRGVENLHTDDAPLGVEIEDDAWTHLLALNDLRFRKADIERIDFRIVTRLHRLRPRSKKTVITRWRSRSYIYHAEHPSVALWYSPEPFWMLWIRLNHLRPA